MFNDPKKDLHQLEKQLWAVEADMDDNAMDDEFQRIYEELRAEFGADRDTVNQMPTNRSVYQAPTPHRIPEKPVELSRERFGFLAFLFCLECLALSAVAFSWLVSLL